MSSLFEDLKEGLEEAIAIESGQQTGARVTKIEIPDLDVKCVRKQTGKTQEQFAAEIGIPVSSLRNWEQGRRSLDPTSRALFTILKHDPNALSNALAAESSPTRADSSTLAKNIG